MVTFRPERVGLTEIPFPGPHVPPVAGCHLPSGKQPDVDFWVGLQCRQHYQMSTRFIDFHTALKKGDSFFKTVKSRRENVPCCVYVAVVHRPAFAASPCSYSQTCPTFRTAGEDTSDRDCLG